MTESGVHLALVVAISLCSVASCAAPERRAEKPAAEQLPDTPAGQKCRAWLRAFNGGHRATYLRFLQKSFPSKVKHLDDELAFRDMTQGFELRKVEKSTATALIALVQERDSDQFARLRLDVEPAAPHVITRLDLLAIPRPAGFELRRMDQSQLVTALRTRTSAWVAADRFAGAALLARNGAVVHAAAYGLADRERRVANTLRTRFRIGSMNKMFTATAVLQLVQAGRIGLDDPVGKHLTDYPNQDVATRVTIRHLLTHTGGTGDFFGPEFEKHRLELRTLRDYLLLYGKRGPEFEPGSRWAYSNYGFLLLGLVIEKSSGQDYYDYVRDHIYRPAGMTASGSEPEDQAVPDRSIGYTKMDGTGRWRRNTDTLPYRGTSAGGGYSTVEDLMRFADALQSHRLLDARHTRLMTTGKVDTPGGRYGFGFSEQTVNGMRCFGHGGGAPGMSGDLRICPDSGYVVAVLANIDPIAAGRVSDFILNRLPPR